MRIIALTLLVTAIVGCRTTRPETEDAEIVRTRSLQQACEVDASSCDRLAFRYAQGIGTEVDLPRAVSLFEKACSVGYADSCYHLAHMYEIGAGVEPDSQRAIALYRGACKAEVVRACNNLAVLLNRTSEDRTEVAGLQEKGCEKGDGAACFNLGFKAEHSRPAQWADAKTYFARGCELDHPASCSYLGIMYRYGRGVSVDLEKGAALYQKACKGGYAIACNNLGFVYQSGEGVEKDLDEAATHFSKACDVGLARACTNLGAVTELGAKSDVTPYDRYRDACRAGDGKGCSRLGVLHLGGKHGAKKEMNEAHDAFKRACDLKYAPGCSNLGVMYEDAIGMKADYDGARVWYELACRYGEFQGCHNLGVMYAKGVGAAKPDLGKAADQFMIACENKYQESCTFLGKAWVEIPGKKDLGLGLLKRACDAGHKPACDAHAASN